MKITRCDGCGLEVQQTGMAREMGWAAIRVHERISKRNTQIKHHEVCPDCLSKVKPLIGKGQVSSV